MRSRAYVTTALFVVVLLFGYANVSAQRSNAGKNQRSFDVYLHVVLGSNDSAVGNELSGRIGSAFGGIRKNYSFSNYRLITSQFQKISTGGQIQSEAIFKNLGGFEMADRPIYTSWGLGSLEDRADEPSGIVFGRFRFEAKVPSKIGNQITYEELSYALSRVAARVGEPTVIGSLSIPQSNEMLFFVIDVGFSDR